MSTPQAAALDYPRTYRGSLAARVVGVIVAGRDHRVLLAALAFGPLLTCMSFDEAQRFLGDFVPLLALGGAIGLAWAIRGCRWLLAPLAALVLFSAWVCFGLAWP